MLASRSQNRALERRLSALPHPLESVESATRREIAIFRSNLFRISEPFVWQQAERMQRYRARYLGRLRFGDGPQGAGSDVVEDLAPRFRIALAAWQMLSRSVGPYQRLLGERRPALIHAHFGIDGVYALPLAQRLGVPLVTTFHGYDATLSTPALLTSPAWFRYPMHRRALAQKGALFLCASEFLRQRVLALGFPEARTHVHYTGVDPTSITPRTGAEETLNILHVARLVEVKGTRYLIAAFAKIATQHPAATLTIIGDGPLRAALEQLAASLGIRNRVHFAGAQPHAAVLAAMRRAAMLVLPSVTTTTGRTEGLGMVLLEAAATGVALVGSRQGGIPEAVIDGVTGLLADEKNVDELAARIDRLLREPDTRRAMGAAGRARIEQHFDIRTQTAALEAHYDALLTKRV